ncbi:MAG: 30S ribosomal protein S12 methylthiotransferase RimO [Planctomycetota bacterium]|jgi:ribosomal protein S12 methylthiotransferase
MAKRKRKQPEHDTGILQPSVALVDLGCAKNTVDSETLLGNLLSNGYLLSTDINTADILLVNTCGFIESSKKESVDNLVEAVRLKKQNRKLKVAAVGCLAERNKDDLLNEVPDLDGIIGLGSYNRMLEICNDIIAGKKVFAFDKNDYSAVTEGPRLLLTGNSYSYLRIADGCDNCCSYCAVPLIRGSFRSRSVDSILNEAESLIDSGVGELDIIAQDITSYGKDSGSSLAELLDKLLKLNSNVWYRLLYAHPAHLNTDVMSMLGSEKQLLGYLDLPVQHINDRILQVMGRKITKSEILDSISKLRENVKNLVLRTSVICGFPGETEQEYEELLDFIKSVKFEHLGAFSYSKEKDTAAFDLSDQIPEKVREERVAQVMEVQQNITFNWIDSRIGKKEEILIDNYMENNILIGRSRSEAPDVDGVIFIKGSQKQPGDKIIACLENRENYDIVALGKE